MWVLEWSRDLIPRVGVHLYATIGASAKPMLGGRGPDHRIELLFGLEHPNRHIAGILASLANYPHHHGTFLDQGHTVPGDEALWGETKMSDFLLQEADHILEPLVLPDRVHVHFLMAIPVYRAELEYKKEHGLDALSRWWDEAKVEITDPHRRPTPLPPPP
ncbi:MAG TPA: suppressor of fused domain protein [Thermoplasmata archaeon]|nr:suppressor of fused domain protein [Thermoplasmata archaeon]